MPLKYAFVLVTFISAIHHSVGRVYLDAGAPGPEPSGDTAWEVTYDRVLRLGHHFGYTTQWRMYTPVVREVSIAEASALTKEGRWIDVPIPNLSAEYRGGRPLWDALFFDFKAAITHYNYFIAAHEPRATRAYLRMLARRVRREQGFEPVQIKVEVRRAPIPSPADHGGFRPHEADFEATEVHTYP